ncbi:MAG: PIF1 family ATP-dependent DNA helicase [Candidatus Omnitrophota bacterium]
MKRANEGESSGAPAATHPCLGDVLKFLALMRGEAGSPEPARTERRTPEAHVAECAATMRRETARSPVPEFSADQAAVFDVAVNRRASVFIAGAAGTGKTFCMLRIHRQLAAMFGSAIVLASSTGKSAVAIGGRTLHGFAGIGLGRESAEQLAARVRKSAAAYKRWRSTDTLIIDEISMISGALFTKLDTIARTVRGRPSEPFGGMQIVACGDFFQLEPVEVAAEGQCFDSPAWRTTFGDNAFMLTVPHRQAGDAPFLRLLDELRDGALSPESSALLGTRVGATIAGGAPWLVARRDRAAKINMDEFAKLGGGTLVYDAARRPGSDARAIDDMLRQGVADERLTLRVGARVMLTANLDLAKGLCNGAMGTVIDFVAPPSTIDTHVPGKTVHLPVVRFDGGVVSEIDRHVWEHVDGAGRGDAWLVQMPLILGWAITIHKAQGMTLDAANVEIGGCFAGGHVYVALSRTRTIAGLRIDAVPDPRRYAPNPAVAEFYRTSVRRCIA